MNFKSKKEQKSTNENGKITAIPFKSNKVTRK